MEVKLIAVTFLKTTIDVVKRIDRIIFI